jgi:asparagine synthase (glutamine-hydrolysing)
LCGIAGIFGKPNAAAVEAMIAAMAHRGPDDIGAFDDHAVALGHRRLAIIDLTPSGHQPMADPSRDIWITFNGEIYNWREERAELERQGTEFRTRSDTEVILALYARHGDDFMCRLRGIFAFAIYDRRRGPGRERLLLARDQFGIKPLLYAENPGSFVFASELKGILASGRIDVKIDAQALRTLLTFGSVCQPRTLIAGVRMLPSAHRMIVDRSGTRIERYWSLATGRDAAARLPYGDAVRHARQILAETVEAQLVADVPVGAFLSGGIDSSLIVALMAQTQRNSIKTFSVGFERDGAEIDESDDAQEVATWLSTDHLRVVVTAADVRDQFERFVVGLDQPSVDGFNSFFVSGAAGRSVKVALSGTGSDELFAGYPWFAGMVETDTPVYKSWSTRLAAILRGSDRSASVQRFLDRYGQHYFCCGPSGPETLLAGDYHTEAGSFVPMSDDLAKFDELSGADVLDRVTALCLNGYTRNQLLRDLDACSMIHSLEVRVPFLDVKIADLALSLHRAAKLKPEGRPLDLQASYDDSGIKRIVVDVARELLPPGFTRRRKRGFGMPFAAWMKGPLLPMFDEALSSRVVTQRGLFDYEAVGRIYDDFRNGHAAWNQAWLLGIIESWCRLVLDRVAKPATRTDFSAGRDPVGSLPKLAAPQFGG